MLPPFDLPHRKLSFQRGEPMFHSFRGRYIFQCLRGKICNPNLLVVGVTDLELTNYNSACQCRTVSAQNERNPAHQMTPASYHAAVWEKDRLSLKVLDWSCLFTWTCVFRFFWLFPVKCLLKHVNNKSFTSLDKGTWTGCIPPYSHVFEFIPP